MSAWGLEVQNVLLLHGGIYPKIERCDALRPWSREDILSRKPLKLHFIFPRTGCTRYCNSYFVTCVYFGHEFLDVTLACEDGLQVEAHKVVLAASSHFLKNL